MDNNGGQKVKMIIVGIIIHKIMEEGKSKENNIVMVSVTTPGSGSGCFELTF